MGKYIVGTGGTFDHLHEGHLKLLEVAFNVGKKVIIGLTTDVLLQQKKFKEFIEPYEIRESGLKDYASSIGREEDLVIIPLHDPFGPAITEPNINIHISSEETFEVAREINDIRRENNLQPMILLMIPMEITDDGSRYSSTKIREKMKNNK
jgi:pantetheine-phosphate adenylyltransferase